MSIPIQRYLVTFSIILCPSFISYISKIAISSLIGSFLGINLLGSVSWYCNLMYIVILSLVLIDVKCTAGLGSYFNFFFLLQSAHFVTYMHIRGYIYYISVFGLGSPYIISLDYSYRPSLTVA